MQIGKVEELTISPEEKTRLQKLVEYERLARLKGFRLIAGIDEVGRGPLAGPVVAASCLVPEFIFIPGVDDSKKLRAKQRQALFETIISDPRLVFGIGVVDSDEIDRINIYQATIQAMLKAVEELSQTPDCLLVDGMNLPHSSISCIKIIKGDRLSQSIAAASIIAKETRDRIMLEYHLKWPEYGFDTHKGYGTSRHLKALEQYGPCDIHRRSFSPCKPISTRRSI